MTLRYQVAILLAMILAVCGVTAMFAKTVEIEPRQPLAEIVEKIPEKYLGDPSELLRDYQLGEVSAEVVIQILLIQRVENEGVFLPLDETDTLFDHYFVDKRQHQYIKRLRIERYQQQQQGQMDRR